MRRALLCFPIKMAAAENRYRCVSSLLEEHFEVSGTVKHPQHVHAFIRFAIKDHILAKSSNSSHAEPRKLGITGFTKTAHARKPRKLLKCALSCLQETFSETSSELCNVIENPDEIIVGFGSSANGEHCEVWLSLLA